MSYRGEFCTNNRNEYHKGFYRDDNPVKVLGETYYSDFFELPDDIEFPYDTARSLLCGSCHLFALSLSKAFGYTQYIIEGISGGGFHSFCQICRHKRWFYVDARGITSDFGEFMDEAKTFVSGEYIIRQVTSEEIKDWENEEIYLKEALVFAEAIIQKYKECYVFP